MGIFRLAIKLKFVGSNSQRYEVRNKGGTKRERPDVYLPVTLAETKITSRPFAWTPLILHGEADQRVPTFQGTEYFQILAARGKTVRMVTYPGSPHFPLLWEQRLNVIQELTDWLAKYNKS